MFIFIFVNILLIQLNLLLIINSIFINCLIKIFLSLLFKITHLRLFFHISFYYFQNIFLSHNDPMEVFYQTYHQYRNFFILMIYRIHTNIN